MLNIGIIGLGSMGYGIARNLINAGHRVWGHDINQAAIDRLVVEGAETGIFREHAVNFDAHA